MGIIYKAINVKTNKVYIGKTTLTLIKRKNKHKENALKNNTSGMFYDSIRKHGWDSFEWEVICIVENSELDYMERKYILEYNSFVDGYNMTEGGTGGLTYIRGTDLYYILKNEGKLGRWLDGTPFSERNPGATKEAIDKRRETFAKKENSEWLRGEKHPNFGRKRKKEYIKKTTGKLNGMYGKYPHPKPVEIDGVVYDSKGKAAAALGVTRATISNRIKNDKFENYKEI